MKNIYLLFISGLFFPIGSYAQSWSFTPPVDVSTHSEKKFYHHLESAGRRNIAVSSQTIAVVWEDDRSGTPAIYLALKNTNNAGFSSQLKISASGEAYEPGIVALTDNRFAISWEEDSKVFVRIVNAEYSKAPESGAAIQLPVEPAMQSGLTASGDKLFVTLSERSERFNRIRLMQLKITDQKNLSLLKNCIVDPEPVKDEQLYPTAVIVDEHIVIAWEDRREGHTIIMGTQSKPGQFCQFEPVQRISKRPGNRNLPYGKGHGVSRVVLGQYGQSGLLAAWADKRNFREGYDIYAAEYDPSGTWGANKPVQDEFGGIARQWHATVAGHVNGIKIVAWSDERESNSDIFFSWFENDEWSEDTLKIITGESRYFFQTDKHPIQMVEAGCGPVRALCITVTNWMPRVKTRLQ